MYPLAFIFLRTVYWAGWRGSLAFEGIDYSELRFALVLSRIDLSSIPSFFQAEVVGDAAINSYDKYISTLPSTRSMYRTLIHHYLELSSFQFGAQLNGIDTRNYIQFEL